jgi:hypothetical protein
MPQCHFHPHTETSVRCVECDRYICPKDFVPTPVGYKCPECARQLPSASRVVKPKQLLVATLAADLVGIGGSYLLVALGLRFWLAGILLGMLSGEAARRASGGHRDKAIAATAAMSVIIGGALFGIGYITMAVGAAAAVIYVMQNRWGA